MKKYDLFFRLFKWAWRQEENFISEAFAYLLSYLLEEEPECGIELIAELTQERVRIPLTEVNAVTVTTQITTALGRPDIEISARDHLVYIEVKLDAQLGEEQLKRYRRALEQTSYEKTSLVLLTRYPVEFCPEEAQPDVNIRWRNVAEWLETVNVREISGFLIRQFHELLKERNIIMEQVSWEFVNGINGLQALMNMLNEAIIGQKLRAIGHNGSWSAHGIQCEGDEKYWIGIYYEEPCILKFEMYNVDNAAQVQERFPYGLFTGQCWSNQRDLASEEAHFFARSKASQLQFIEEFLEESLKYATVLRRQLS